MANEIFKLWLDEGQTVLPTLLLKHYRDIGLSNNELVLLLQLKSYMDKGNLFPNINKIANHMHMSEENVFKAIHQLTQKKVLAIDTAVDENGITQDAYSLELLWEKLYILLKQHQVKENEHSKEESSKNLYQIFEQEFGRPLSPIEMETLVMWVEDDKYSPDLVQMALKEAVLSQVYNFKYIDRILLNWEKKNIRTKEQVESESKKYRELSNTNDNSSFEPKRKSEPVPMINWLKDLNRNQK